eukprot:TRINITY_DN115012_c0_g1_i1.p1 TRINITY_DN115012_c0_g1~~TRINITY_DN115012_c0_g1_i1.p1  ORF type:complete len:228 (-),score=37.80 TRINITY_DN115012_c0_g1_i1:35-718(-)
MCVLRQKSLAKKKYFTHMSKESVFTFGSTALETDASSAFTFSAAPAEETPKKDEAEAGADTDEKDDKHFEPIVSVSPVKTVTMEEDEEVLVKFRASLYVWTTDTWEKEVQMWKQRGTGDIKLLKHAKTGKIRVLMRQEKTLKLIMNHYVLPNLQLKENVGSDKGWVWKCPSDFADGESKAATFAVRFKDSKIANQFKEEFEKCQKENQLLIEASKASAGKTEGAAAT